MNPFRALGPRWDAILAAAVVCIAIIAFGLAGGEAGFALVGAVLLACVALAAVMRVVVYDDPPPVSGPILYGVGWLIMGFVALALVDAFGLAGVACAAAAAAVYAALGAMMWRRQIARWRSGRP